VAKYGQLVASGLPAGVLLTVKNAAGLQVPNLYAAGDATAPDNRALYADGTGSLTPAVYVPNGTYTLAWSGGSQTIVVSSGSGEPVNPGYTDQATQAELDAATAAELARTTATYALAATPGDTAIPVSAKAAASGIATLDSGSVVVQNPKLHAARHAPGDADDLSASFAALAGPAAFTGDVKVKTLAVGNATIGLKRQPSASNVVIDGSTLSAAGPLDKVGSTNSVTFQGGFSGETGYGASNPGFLFGANDFIVTGTTSGDGAGVSNMWARLTEVHYRVPNGAITNLYGLVAQSNVDATATGATVAGWLASLYATAPKNLSGATVANAASFYVDSPAASTATAQYAIYQAGTGANFFGGAITANSGIIVGGGASGFKVTTATTPNVQGSAQGVYLGVNGGAPAIELADGTNTYRIDNTSGSLRFLKAGVQVNMTLDLTGALTVKQGVGFYNTAPTTKQAVTGSRGANAALASLITALAAYGLVTDSSSA
jgi:hypothetical protein